MLRVGLTGGTGAGKSTVARRLAELGAVVVDADQLAREVLAPGSEGLAAVAARFGEGVLTGEGTLDRAALAARVFADAGARRALEEITHPRIAARTAALVAAAPPDAVVVHDVPLLVEKRMGAAYHLVVVVHADEETRVRRLARSGRMSEADARARVRAQATDAERRAAADVWLDNSATEPALLDAVDRLWRQRLVPFEENVRLRRRSRRPEVLTLTAPDPTWPAQAARLVARVDLAAGSLGRGTAHIGSTSVPGLVAKDVIDLQLGVASLEDADALADRLADAGFPRVDHVTADEPKPAGTGPWPKRFHGGADPQRVVHLHVREVGSEGWTFALLFRDWLRAESSARADYEAEKQRLAAAHRLASDYAAAKEPWFDQAHARAVEWAARTGWRPPQH